MVAGVNYTLPLLIDSELRIDSDGHFRLELESALQLTDRLRFDWNWNTEDEYRVRVSYEINKKMALPLGMIQISSPGQGLSIGIETKNTTPYPRNGGGAG